MLKKSKPTPPMLETGLATSSRAGDNGGGGNKGFMFCIWSKGKTGDLLGTTDPLTEAGSTTKSNLRKLLCSTIDEGVGK